MTTENPVPKRYELASDEKEAQIMVYLSNCLCWGSVVIKEQFRASTWLRTQAAPDTICLYESHMLLTTTNPPTRLAFTELHIPSNHVLAIHITPPGKDPPDYDPDEPNRKMVQVKALVGSFLIIGYIRMSVQSDLKKYFEINRENFTSLYDVEISNPSITTLGAIRTPHILVRQPYNLFGLSA